ncbi:MAG: tRNA dihydrouridine synthase DusB [Thermoflexales bacterium]|nr:tRNA dihydrouridine synthase DusB [Thermoflexales bacterium]MDW8351454.1 tRNA dihydrouridine synthase DusB [Anaerolineae bacterium]
MQPTFYVRDIPVYGDLILSPMDGFSDLPYRLICREYGSAMSYTEFTACEAILRDAKPALRQLDYHPSEKPQLTFQIFDSDEDRIVACAQKIEQLGPGIIDLNMGCSVSSVSGRGAGAGLLRDPQKIGRIFSRMSKAVRVPVTGKIRLGWDAKSRNYIQVAKILEDNGASLIAVHGRTKEQGYKGVADWDAIAEVKQAVKIPVIGNGDVKTVADIARIKAHTGCDGVMIGRAAIGNPWIFQRKDRHQVTVEEVIALLKRHLQAMIAYYGEHGLILFRKHAVKYMHGMPHVAALRAQLVTCESVGAFHDLVDDFRRRYEQGMLPDDAYEAAAPEEEGEWSCDRAAVACA